MPNSCGSMALSPPDGRPRPRKPAPCGRIRWKHPPPLPKRLWKPPRPRPISPPKRKPSPGAKRSRACCAISNPGMAALTFTVLCGIGRVVAFIGVGVLGALLIAAPARRTSHSGPRDHPFFIAAPVAGLLHWLESWRAHDMAYRLLAEMRIALFARLDRVGARLLMRRRAGDLVSLATPGRRDGRVFLRPYHRPGRGRDPGAGDGADRAGQHRLAAGHCAPALPPLRRPLPGAAAARGSISSAPKAARRWAGSARM